MEVGFTGTRDEAIPEVQRTAFEVVLDGLNARKFRHGDCIGWDATAAQLAFSRGIWTVCHPPSSTALRAHTTCNHEYLPPLNYMPRNRVIVDTSHVLVACPRELERQERGGTWYTVDYARRRGKRVIVVWPDGMITDSGSLPREGNQR